MQQYVPFIDERIDSVLTGGGSLNSILKWSLKGGKRIRPSMSLDIVKSLQGKVDFRKDSFFIDASLTIEFIHSSSLIIDDLPCMDNDFTRRGRASVHVEYGEATAQLTAISMLSEAFRLLLRAVNGAVSANYFTREQGDRIGMELAELLSEKIGVLGASGGQYMELAIMSDNLKKLSSDFEENKVQPEVVREYMDKKTGAFFEVAFVIGYLFGGGAIDNIGKVMECAKLFGKMYQLTDDYEDMEKDAGTSVNFFNMFGMEKGLSEYKGARKRFVKEMKVMGLYSRYFKTLVQALDRKYGENSPVLQSNLLTHT